MKIKHGSSGGRRRYRGRGLFVVVSIWTATARGATRRIFPGYKKVKLIGMTEQKKRGGARPGAGRKKGSVDKRFMQQPEQRVLYEGVETPLQYLLAVMRDPFADFRRRDKAAKAAAPYCHTKITSDAKGNKQAGEAAAQTAGS